MKPVYLEFCGINSFSETAKIQFDKLLSGGIFGIFGDTGSGKSTVLDAIHFALYGEVDRVPKAFADCINHKCDTASVTFDFSLQTAGARHTYRVQRERKRKASGTKAYLYEYTQQGKLFPLAEGARDVDSKIIEIIGLTFEDFKTCIALPQGDFAALVKASPSDRVKLVARLFNLERYGERLSIAINQKSKDADEAVRLVQAKMGENAVDEQTIDSLKIAVEETKAQLLNLQNERERAMKERSRIEMLVKEWREYETQKQKWTGLCERLPQMQALQKQLERLPQAKAVAEKAESLSRTRAERDKALRHSQDAEISYAKLIESVDEQKSNLEKQNYDARILEQTVILDKIKGAQADIKNADDAKKRFDECCTVYRSIKDKCPQEDFVGKKQEIEKNLAVLGEDEGLLAFLKTNYKDVLLADTYFEVRKDLREIAKAYPQTQAVVEKLIEKYSVKNAVSESVDIAKINLEYKKAEQERKKLNADLQEIEKRELAYRQNEKEKEFYTIQGKILREAYETARDKVADIRALGTETEVGASLQALKDAQKQAQDRLEQTNGKLSQAHAEWQAQKALHEKLSETATEIEKTLALSLIENAFESVDEAQALLKQMPQPKEVDEFFQEYKATRLRIEETDESKFNGISVDALERAETLLAQLQSREAETSRDLGATETRLQNLLCAREKYKELEKEYKEKQNYAKLCEQLKILVRGTRFLEYIAAEYLQEISARAGKTLLSLTNGKYFLEYQDKEFKVGDNLDGGKLRSTKTLSGGETFLVSLSLALSLSTSIFMKSLRPIEFFFLDEGFGTLDEKLVDTVMDVLGKLSKNFSVGLISHVEELKRRIENKIEVLPAGINHGSKILH